MAAITVASRVDTVMGNRRVIFAAISNVQNGFTMATGLQAIDLVEVTPTTAAAVGATTAGGTITFVTGATLAGQLMVIGT